MTIDLQTYPDICSSCGSSARTERITGEIIGIEDIQVCVNPTCMNFDQLIIQRRELAEAAVRQSSAYRRKTLWKPEIRRHARQQRKLRTAIAKLPLTQQV